MLAIITNRLLSVFTIIGLVGLLVLLAALASVRLRRLPLIKHWLDRYAGVSAWAIALFATAGSLWYSNIIGYPPCSLCWWQRIFLYPQAIVLGLALWKKDVHLPVYGLGLSIPGAFVAAYHTYLQWSGVSLGFCSDQAISCAQRFVLQFGYITLPLMSVVAFALLIVLFLHIKRLQTNSSKIL